MKPEIISATKSTRASHLLLSVIADGLVPLTPGKPEVEVVFTVNGIQVPFEKVANAMFARYEDDFKERVAREAYEIVSGTKLEPIMTAIRHAEWSLKQEIEKITGVKLGED